jgi:hypothetical protein
MFLLKSLNTGQEFQSSTRPVLVSGVWECSDNRVTDPAGNGFEVVEVGAVRSRQITVLAFRKRFTRSEKAAMEFAAIDNPSAPEQERRQAAAMRADFKDNDAAEFIDLDDERTREGVMYLESVGLLDEGRALEILDAPVQDVERL